MAGSPQPPSRPRHAQASRLRLRDATVDRMTAPRLRAGSVALHDRDRQAVAVKSMTVPLPLLQLPVSGQRLPLGSVPGSGDAWLIARLATAGQSAPHAGRALRRRVGVAATARRDPILRAHAAGASAARLGDAALRPVLAAPGPGVRTARHTASRVPPRMRRVARCGVDSVVPARTPVAPRRVHVLLHARRARWTRPGCARS